MILSSGNIPDCWKENNVIFIPKPGSRDIRPITLTSNLSKFFEKIIYRRLEYWCDRNDIIPPFQFGFNRCRSVLDPVSILCTSIESGFSLGKMTGAIFLDLKGAFDNVDPFLLCKLLCRLGVPNSFVLLIYNFISFRISHGYSEGKLIGSGSVEKGVPQGSILSPLLFSIFLCLIGKHIPDHSKILLYADDIVIFSSSSNLKTIFLDLNHIC